MSEDRSRTPSASTLIVDCARESGAWDQMPALEALAERAIAAAQAESGVRLRHQAEVSLLFCDDAAILALNKKWRGKDKPTNVLSFPAVPPQAVARAMALGDIALAYETCAREALAEGKALEDHLCHLIMHGFLHLLGYDHEESEAQARAMEALERRALARLGIADPYGDGNELEGTNS